jgi:hypothetical protein
METSAQQHSLANLPEELHLLRQIVQQQSRQIARLEASMRELIDLSLLPEAERAARAELHRHQRIASIRSRIHQVLATGQYGPLEPLVHELEAFRGDAEAESIKLDAWAARDAALAEAVSKLNESLGSMMSVGQWQQAMAAVQSQLVRFPQQPELVAIRKRVEHEYTAWREVAANRLYAQIRDAVDRREWQRALRDAEDMAARFSDHPRGAKVIQQLSTIRENAEIEHRQTIERDIQQLIRSRRFDDAIRLAEDLIRQYPLSPQAAECRTLLPRLEQMAMQDESDQLNPSA